MNGQPFFSFSAASFFFSPLLSRLHSRRSFFLFLFSFPSFSSSLRPSFPPFLLSLYTHLLLLHPLVHNVCIRPIRPLRQRSAMAERPLYSTRLANPRSGGPQPLNPRPHTHPCSCSYACPRRCSACYSDRCYFFVRFSSCSNSSSHFNNSHHNRGSDILIPPPPT